MKADLDLLVCPSASLGHIGITETPIELQKLTLNVKLNKLIKVNNMKQNKCRCTILTTMI
jgi:hypothetical protein